LQALVLWIPQRFDAEDVLGSKLEGARWARPRWPTPSIHRDHR